MKIEMKSMAFLLSAAVTWEDSLGWRQREGGSLVSEQNLLDLREEDCASYLEQGSDEMKAVFKRKVMWLCRERVKGKYYRHGHHLESCALHGHQVTKNHTRLWQMTAKEARKYFKGSTVFLREESVTAAHGGKWVKSKT